MGSPWLGMGPYFGKMMPWAPGRFLDTSRASGRPYKIQSWLPKSTQNKKTQRLELYLGGHFLTNIAYILQKQRINFTKNHISLDTFGVVMFWNGLIRWENEAMGYRKVSRYLPGLWEAIKNSKNGRKTGNGEMTGNSEYSEYSEYSPY